MSLLLAVRRGWPYVSESWTWLALLAFASLLAGVLEAAVLYLVAQVAASFAETGGSRTVDFDAPQLGNYSLAIGHVLGLAGLLIALKLLVDLVAAWVPAKLSAETMTSTRRQVSDAYFEAPWRRKASEVDGHFQEVMTTQTYQVAQNVLAFANVTSSVLSLSVIVVAAVALSWEAALLVCGVSVATFRVLRPLILRSKRMARLQLEASELYAEQLAESSSVAQEIEIFAVARAASEVVVDRARNVSKAFSSLTFHNGVSSAAYRGVALSAIVGALGVLTIQSSVDVARVTPIMLLYLRAVAYSQSLQTMYQKLVSLSPYVERIEAYIAHLESDSPESDSAERGDHSWPASLVGGLAGLGVSLDGVSFSYGDGREVLRDLDFEVAPGEVVGIAGASGIGKTTLLQLILGLHEPMAGTVLVWSEPEERRAPQQGDAAYLPQESRLVNATVTENIRFYRSWITDQSIRDAASLAGIDREIEALRDGYHTRIGPRVSAVSGGQRQRICLARALAGAPGILVLDEPTSALDDDAELVVCDAIDAMRGQTTCLVVSHRASTLDRCDRVVSIVQSAERSLLRELETRSHDR